MTIKLPTEDLKNGPVVAQTDKGAFIVISPDTVKQMGTNTLIAALQAASMAS